MEGPASPREHHPAIIQWLSSPRRLALAVVGALLAWTALLGVAAHLSGIASPTQPAAAPRGLGPRRRLLRSAGTAGAAADDEEDSRWTDKLLGDLQNSASDESTSATIAELRSTLAAREDRFTASAARGGGGSLPAARLAASTSAAAAVAAPLVKVPRYDPTSVAELQKAALAASLPEHASGPLPQLVRDLMAAMQRQQAEHEALQKRLAQLQPAVINYNPKDVDELSKAVGEATKTQGAEVSGALPKLLRDLRDTVSAQKDEQRKLQRQLSAVSGRKARSTRYASVLKQLVMGSTAMGAAEKVTLLFGELSDRCTQAVDEARARAELDSESSDSPLLEGEENGKWQDTHSKLQEMVLEELRLGIERNATLSAALSAEQARCLALDATVKSLTTPPPNAPPPPEGMSTSTEGAMGSNSDGGTSAADGLAPAGMDTPPAAAADAPADAASPIAEPTADSPPSDASPTDATPPTAADSPPPPSSPPPPATGSCAGKRCPVNYDMIDRGDRCTCRPSA